MKSFFKKFFTQTKNIFFKIPKILRIILIIIFVAIVAFLVYSSITSQKKVTYRTTQVTKGTLITSISATGTVTSSNKSVITTGATGTIKKVYVKNGDTVKKGQKIADLSLDSDGLANQTAAWANYLTMRQNYQDAVTDQSTTDIQMWNDHQSHLNALDAQTSMTTNDTNPKTNKSYTTTERMLINKTVTQAYQNFKASELRYNDASAFTAKAQTQVSTAYENYQKVSSTIYAPTDGVISNLSLAEGVIISNSSSSITVSTGTNASQNSSTVTSHIVGSITNPKGQYQATLSLTESDIVKIKSGQKVTLTMDAFSGITFTGEVLSVDVAGSTSSGVTSYSVVVLLDKTDKEIYTNMSVTASIIVNSKADILLIPSTAIDTATDGITTVRTMKDNIISTITITTGDSNDSETEVKSGLNEGDNIISSSITNEIKANNNTTSAFSSSSRNSSSSNRNGSFTIMSAGPPGGF